VYVFTLEVRGAAGVDGRASAFAPDLGAAFATAFTFIGFFARARFFMARNLQ